MRCGFLAIVDRTPTVHVHDLHVLYSDDNGQWVDFVKDIGLELVL